MLDLEKRITGFIETGAVLRNVARNDLDIYRENNLQKPAEALGRLIREAHHFNGWFTEEMVSRMVTEIGESLEEESVRKWLTPYVPLIKEDKGAKSVAVIMAGNLPAVGFNDFLSVLMAGHSVMARLSRDDDKLLPAIADILVSIEPGFKSLISFRDEKLAGFDAVIATGSNNTSRYFEYYFGRYPHIIRKNRNGVAVLTGGESPDDLSGLSQDIFLYFGLGCRNVSKVYVPRGYDFQPLLDVLAQNRQVILNSKYLNNYEYNKAIFLINKSAHYDSSNLLLTESEEVASPVSVLHYEFYDDRDQLLVKLGARAEDIQCLVSADEEVPGAIRPGQTQSPALWDYADGVDTMKFLLTLDN